MFGFGFDRKDLYCHDFMYDLDFVLMDLLAWLIMSIHHMMASW